MIKQALFRIVDQEYSQLRANKLFNGSIMLLIILSVIVIILESVNSLNESYRNIFFAFNTFSIVVFTIEYMIRLYVSDLSHPSSSRIKSAFKFIFSRYGIIDLLAILPFYIPRLLTIDLRFIRTIRLARFLRVLKLNRHNKSLTLIWEVIKEKRSELAVTGFVSLLILVFASFLIYFAENKVQPNAFPNILASMWWAVATLTTVGYGDVYPITALGKLLAALIAILGIGLVALPTGIISAGFISKIKQDKDQTICPYCGKEIES